jgi:hypothetical protein
METAELLGTFTRKRYDLESLKGVGSQEVARGADSFLKAAFGSQGMRGQGSEA